MKKIAYSLLSALLISSIFTMPSEAESEKDKPIKVSSIKKVKEVANEGNIAIVNPKELKVEDVEKDLGIKLKVSPKNKNAEISTLGVIKVEDEYVPVYVVLDNKAEVSEKVVEKSITEKVKKHRDKVAKEKKNNKNAKGISIASVGTNYTLQGTAMEINYTLSNIEGDFWTTEYRAYEGSGENNSLDFYFLRADHDYDGDPMPYYDETMYAFKSQWWKYYSDMDLIDPEPNDATNTSQISIGLPGGISWTTSLDGDNPDIDLSFEIDDDFAVWAVEDDGVSISENNDFDFTQGVYIESDEDNKGFKMNVMHEGFHDGWDTNDTSDWYIDEDITFYDPDDDLSY